MPLQKHSEEGTPEHTPEVVAHMQSAPSALLADENQSHVTTVMPQTGSFGVGLMLFKAMVGAGLFALPYAFMMMGIGGAIIASVVICVLTWYTNLLIIRAKDVIQRDTFKTNLTYVALVQHCFGNGVGRLVFGLVLFTTLGGNASYLIFMGSVLNSMVQSISIQAWAAIVAALCFPLCLVTDGRFLARISMAGNLGVALVTVTVLVRGAQVGSIQPLSSYTSFQPSSFMGAFGIIGFLYAASTTMLTINRSMHDKRKFGSAMAYAMVFTCAVCSGFGLVNYLYFGAGTCSVVVLNLGSGAAAYVAKIAIVVDLIFSYPLALTGGREILERALFTNATPHLFAKQAALRLLVVAITWCVVFFPSFGIVLNIVGGWSVSLLAFVIPCLLLLQLRRFHLRAYAEQVAFMREQGLLHSGGGGAQAAKQVPHHADCATGIADDEQRTPPHPPGAGAAALTPAASATGGAAHAPSGELSLLHQHLPEHTRRTSLVGDGHPVGAGSRAHHHHEAAAAAATAAAATHHAHVAAVAASTPSATAAAASAPIVPAATAAHAAHAHAAAHAHTQEQRRTSAVLRYVASIMWPHSPVTFDVWTAKPRAATHPDGDLAAGLPGDDWHHAEAGGSTAGSAAGLGLGPAATPSAATASTSTVASDASASSTAGPIVGADSTSALAEAAAAAAGASVSPDPGQPHMSDLSSAGDAPAASNVHMLHIQQASPPHLPDGGCGEHNTTTLSIVSAEAVDASLLPNGAVSPAASAPPPPPPAAAAHAPGGGGSVGRRASVLGRLLGGGGAGGLPAWELPRLPAWFPIAHRNETHGGDAAVAAPHAAASSSACEAAATTPAGSGKAEHHLAAAVPIAAPRQQQQQHAVPAAHGGGHRPGKVRTRTLSASDVLVSPAPLPPLHVRLPPHGAGGAGSHESTPAVAAAASHKTPSLAPPGGVGDLGVAAHIASLLVRPRGTRRHGRHAEALLLLGVGHPAETAFLVAVALFGVAVLIATTVASIQDAMSPATESGICSGGS